MIFLIIALIGLIALIPSDNNSVYRNIAVWNAGVKENLAACQHE